MKVIVTGGSGFIGSHISKELSAAGASVLVVDRIERLVTESGIEYSECDLRDPFTLAKIVRRARPDAIVHAAAITPSDERIDHALDIVMVNQVSTMALLVEAQRAGCGQFVLLSSAGVYADPPGGQLLDESSALSDPGGLYAQTKIASERHCRWATELFGIASTILRLGPAYGEFERPTDSRVRMSAVYQVVELVAQGHAVRCSDPATAYNWIHGRDVGQALVRVLSGISGSRTYNLAGPATTMSELLETVSGIVGVIPANWLSDPGAVSIETPGRQRNRLISTVAIERDLEFFPQIPLERGLNELLALRRRDGERAT